MPTTNARIAYSNTDASISVWLTGLQADFVGTRRADWTLSGPTSDSRSADGSATVTFTRLQARTTYTISCDILVSPKDGTPTYYTPINSPISVTTDGPRRPDTWIWRYVASDYPLDFPASEWNGFTARINEFRDYKDKSSYYFTTARAGMDITTSIVNEAVSAINDMSPPTRASYAVAGVTDFDLSYFNSIARALNSIS